MPLIKVAQNANATAGQSFIPHTNNYFRFVVKNNRIFYVTHFFSLSSLLLCIKLYDTAFVLYQSAMTVSGTRWHLLSSDDFLKHAVFCCHKLRA